MTTHTARVVAPHRCTLGESPVWLARTHTLCWVDIPAGVVHRVSGAGAALPPFAIAAPLSMLVPDDDGGWVAAVGDRVLCTTADGSVRHEIARIPRTREDVDLNDGRCDARGRLYLGSLTKDWSKPGVCQLHRVTSAETAVLAEGLTCSNGIEWSLDGTVLYHVDSYDRRLYAWRFDLATGSIEDRRVAVSFPEAWGLPDGMCRDTDGRLWIACFNGGRVVCWDPRQRAFTEDVAVGAPQVTSCAFGGEDMGTLFITTAAFNYTPSDLERHPDAGKLFAARTGARGFPPAPFQLASRAGSTPP